MLEPKIQNNRIRVWLACALFPLWSKGNRRRLFGLPLFMTISVIYVSESHFVGIGYQNVVFSEGLVTV